MEAPALIVIDMLNDFLQAWAPASKQRLVDSTNALVGILRDRNRPVVMNGKIASVMSNEQIRAALPPAK
jgi:nicotinamidase-related amidase